jgi:hypothetical protein
MNDNVESNYGCYDSVMRTFRGATVAHLSGLTQQMRNHDFEMPQNVAQDRRKRKEQGGASEAAEDRGGFYYYGLSERLRESLVDFTRHAAEVARAENRADLKVNPTKCL